MAEMRQESSCVNPCPDKFILCELIGSGSFSNVYRAIHKESRKNLALKNFKLKVSNFNHHFKYAAREVAYLKLLNHSNIIKMDCYELQGTYIYIAVEYSPLGNLKDYIRKNSRILCEPIIKNIMKQLCTALCYLHELGIYHGDLKPDNTIVTNEVGPEIKLCDFGLTDIYLKDSYCTNNKAGSLYYMAPELHLGFPFNCSCDLYSAGVVMYEMMYGKKPFSTVDKSKYLTVLRQRTLPDYPAEETARYTRECVDLVKALMSYDKQNRYSGKTLTSHPFLSIPNVEADLRCFYTEGCKAIISAFSEGNRGNYGNALVDATAAIILLKLHYNRIEDPNLKKYVEDKWEEYSNYCSRLEDALMHPHNHNLWCYKQATDEVLRYSLACTPTLANGFDIGCAGEMYLKDADYEKGLLLLKQATEIVLEALKSEPSGFRRSSIGARLEKWIRTMEWCEHRKSMLTSGRQAKTDVGNSSQLNQKMETD